MSNRACQCCGFKEDIEKGISLSHWGLCADCQKAVDLFINTRREVMEKK